MRRDLATPAGLLVRFLLRYLPGVLAIACAVCGTYVLFGVGWALLAAVPFLLALDWTARRPR